LRASSALGAVIRLPGTQLEPDLLVYPVIHWKVPTTGVQSTIDLCEVFAGFE
jgi:hypothetical protein